MQFGLRDFPDGKLNCFKIFYGADGTGDICNNDNILAFSELVHGETNDVGVALAVADGGIKVAGYENEQELIHKQLILCELLIGLSVLRQGMLVRFFTVYLACYV